MAPPVTPVQSPMLTTFQPFTSANNYRQGIRFRDLYGHAVCLSPTTVGSCVQALATNYAFCLSRDQVRELIPILQRFADTGELA